MKKIIMLVAAIMMAPSVIAEMAGGPDVVPLPGLQRPVQVLRDTDGVPHILAQTRLDAARVQGWVMAGDRLFQMDVFRRQANGTLAELLGPDALASDVELRILGLRRAAEASIDVLQDKTRAVLEAFAAGVNAWVAQNPLPPEYGALEISVFEPWSAVDSVVVGKALAFNLSFDLDIGNTETLIGYELTGDAFGFDGTALYFEDLRRSAPFDPASSVPDATGTGMDRTAVGPTLAKRLSRKPGESRIHPATLALARNYLERAQRVPLLRRALDRLSSPIGSNEWAVSGALTANGRPLLANDPHLALDSPATFYQNHLVSPVDGLDVIGSSVPGTPGIVAGQNKRIAWGVTTNGTDVTDLYEEQVVIDPDAPFLLATVYEGQNEPVLGIVELFRYNEIGDGSFDNLTLAPPNGNVNGTYIAPFSLIVPRRNNGALVDFDLGSGFGLSVQYTGTGATRELDTFQILNTAEDLTDFRRALQFFDFGSQNFAYADVDGNVAYFASAEVPVREDLQAGVINGLPPSFIRNGSGGNEWLAVQNPQPQQSLPYEILPFAELAQTVNPAAGFVVNANNDPVGNTLDNDPLNETRPGGGIYYLEYSYAIGTRAGRITQALRQRLDSGPVTRADMAAIQADVVMLDAQVFSPYIVAAFGNAQQPGADAALAALAADARIAEAVARLAAWDHSALTGVAEGYDAADTNGDRLEPVQAEIDASIAATIYSVWRGQVLANTLDATLAPLGLSNPGSGDSLKALRNLLDNFGDNAGTGASGLDFFQVPGVTAAEDRRDIVLLTSLSDALDLLAGPAFASAFGNSTDQEDYRWGRLHRIVFDSLLGDPFSIPSAGGTFPPSFDDLEGLATDGGFGVVDASSHSARAADAEGFRFGSGPVRRYVGVLGPVAGSISGTSALPGGASGVLGSPWYTNLLGRWLTNDGFPLRQRRVAIQANVAERIVFLPAAPAGRTATLRSVH